MGQTFKDSQRYASLHTKPQGPGDNRPTSLQILNDNDVIDRLHDKVFLVTGGSNGLGVDEVKAFARTGARVFFTSRDLAKGERVRDEILKELTDDKLESTPKVRYHFLPKSEPTVRRVLRIVEQPILRCMTR